MLALSACRLQPAHVPFPGDESVVAAPVVKPLVPGAATALHPQKPDTTKPPQVLPFDYDQLGSRHFGFNDFKPVSAPFLQTKLDWDHLPDSNLHLTTDSAHPFVVKKSILPQPAIVKAGIPKLLANTTTGMLQFSAEEGLPGTQITASLIDDYGSTWIATEKGLCRYTGDYLYIYSFLDKTRIGSDYTITKMVLDRQGNIWMVTAGNGIYVMDVTNNILLHHNTELIAGDILCDHRGLIWITSFYEGLFIIDPVKKTFKNLRQVPEKSMANGLTAITEDRNKNIWLGYFDHIAVIDSARQHLKNISKKDGLPGTVVIRFLEDVNADDMWVSLYGSGISYISLKNKTLNTIDPKHGFNGIAVQMIQDARQQLWLFRKDTSYIINKERTAIRPVLMDIQLGRDFFIGSSLLDRSGNIWLGTLDKGVLIIDSKGPLPEHLNTGQGLVDNNIWGALEYTDGRIWLATRQGINIYNPANGSISVLNKNSGLETETTGRLLKDNSGNILFSTGAGFAIIHPEKKFMQVYGKAQGFDNTNISTCVADTGGQLWFSSTIYGLIGYNTTTRSLIKLDKKSGFTSNIVWDIKKDEAGKIWAATDSGIAVFNPANYTIQYIGEKQGLCHKVVYKLLMRANGDVWAGTLKGISIINIRTGHITNLTRKEGLYPEEIYDIIETNGVVYAGSSAGLIVIRQPADKKNTWSFVNYGKREGFPYNDYNQNSGTHTRNGQTWWGITPVLTVVTQAPLYDTTLPQVTITGINIMDQPAAFVTNASYKKYLKPGDTLWNETKTAYYLRDALPKDSGYLTGNNIRWDSTRTYYNIPVGLTLPYHQNSVNFSFTNNDIKGREKIMYRYILEGADTAWSIPSDKSSTRNYFNLGAGHYTFRVSTRGFNGTWSKPAECSFTILPPWWKTWWAYLLYIIISAAIVSAYAHFRSKQLLQKNLELEDKIRQRTSELSQSLDNLKATQTQLVQAEKMASLGELTAGIAHEIQNPLNFVNNFSEVSSELLDEMNAELDKGDIEEAKAIATDVKQNLEKITHHGKRADAIVKGMLQHSRNSSGQKEPTDINALCDEYLRLSYHGLRAKDKTFNAKFETFFDNSIGKINIVPQDIGRVVLNLINNAFYAVNEKGRLSVQNQASRYEPTVTVTTKKLNGAVEIKITDNGNGIPETIRNKIFQPFFTTKPTGQGTGLGLSLSYDIVTKGHGGELKVETREGEGTAFTIALPAPTGLQ